MDKLKKLKIISIVFTGVAGSLLHFVYNWSGNNMIAGIFGSVNESVWEHLKIAFWAMIIWSVIEFFLIGRKNTAFIPSRAVALFLAPIVIMVLFFTYSGILGRHYLWLDMLIYLIGIAAGEYAAYRIMRVTKYSKFKKSAIIISAVLILLLMAAFIIFTFKPLPINLFKG